MSIKDNDVNVGWVLSCCPLWIHVWVWACLIPLGDCDNQDLLHLKRMQQPAFDGTRIMGWHECWGLRADGYRLQLYDCVLDDSKERREDIMNRQAESRTGCAMMCVIWKLLLVWLLFLALGGCGNQDLLHLKRMQQPAFDGTRIMGWHRLLRITRWWIPFTAIRLCAWR